MLLNVAMEAAPELKGHLNKENNRRGRIPRPASRWQMIHWKDVKINELKPLVEKEADLEKLVDQHQKYGIRASDGRCAKTT